MVLLLHTAGWEMASTMCQLRDLSLVAAAASLAVTLYILSLRLRAQRDQPPPWPPNRKMGGVLTYEFGKICRLFSNAFLDPTGSLAFTLLIDNCQS